MLTEPLSDLDLRALASLARGEDFGIPPATVQSLARRGYLAETHFPYTLTARGSQALRANPSAIWVSSLLLALTACACVGGDPFVELAPDVAPVAGDALDGGAQLADEHALDVAAPPDARLPEADHPELEPHPEVGADVLEERPAEAGGDGAAASVCCTAPAVGASPPTVTCERGAAGARALACYAGAGRACAALATCTLGGDCNSAGLAGHVSSCD